MTSLSLGFALRVQKCSLSFLFSALWNHISANSVDEDAWPEPSGVIGHVPVINEKTSQTG